MSSVRIVAAGMALAVAVHATVVCGDVVYKGDGTAGGLMPDITQYQGQRNNGICAAAASADVLWYIDQHGFDGLVAHQDKNKPNDTWKDDSKALVLDMANRIFGPKYVAGEGGPVGGLPKGLAEYIKSKHYYANTTDNTHDKGLVVQQYSALLSSYQVWKQFSGAAVDSAVGDFYWRDANNRDLTYTNNVGTITTAHHAMTSAGYDTADKLTEVTMGWGDHPANVPPYKKPPYGAGEEPYFDEYNIRLSGPGASKMMNIDKKEGVNLFNRLDAARVVLDNFVAVRTAPHVKPKPAAPQPGKPGARKYSYSVENFPSNEFAVQQWFLQIDVPFDLTSIEVPSGWNARSWDPRLTPEVTPTPAGMPAPGDDFSGDPDLFSPNYGGLLFYTLVPSLAVPVGGTLEGFAFQADDVYRYADDALWSGLSSTTSAFLDPSYTGMISEFAFTGGPILVPEPSTAVLLTILPLGWLLRRRPLPAAAAG